MNGVANVNVFSDTRPRLNCDCTVYMDMYSHEGSGGFDGKFSFNSLIIFEDTLFNNVIIIDMALVCLYQGIVNQGFSVARNGLPFCNNGNIEEHILGKSKSPWACL